MRRFTKVVSFADEVLKRCPLFYTLIVNIFQMMLL